jgi:glycosyltransferase involved in cell wall biosynthesis
MMSGASPTSDLRLAVAPLEVRANTFVRQFTQSLRAAGLDPVPYGYEPELPTGTRIVILHWPNRFFAPQSADAARAAADLLAAWRTARHDHGVRFIWVAHNVQPHDAAVAAGILAGDFLALLDGIIHLSADSPATIRAAHGPLHVRELVTRHGHYRDLAATPSRPWPATDAGIRLGYVGRIRPYKGIEDLLTASAAAAVPDLTISIAGFRHDAACAAAIEAGAVGRGDVRLDIRDTFLSDVELEATIDACHGIVLPYRSILTSGTALFALSRDRPVLAPRLGALGELGRDVGERWLSLYDGELSPATLRAFASRLRSHDGGSCDLSAYDWGPIAAGLREFIDEIARS